MSLSVLTGNGISTLCIGALLVTMAVALAVETKSLVIGESALPEELSKIEQSLLATPGVLRVIHLRTMHLGPEELLLVAKIGVAADGDGADIVATIDAEARVRAVLPTAKVIYPDPEISCPQSTSPDAEPPAYLVRG